MGHDRDGKFIRINYYVREDRFTLQITVARPMQVDICHNHALTSFLIYSKLCGLTSTSMDRDSIDGIVHFQSVETNVILRIDFSGLGQKAGARLR